MEAMEGARGVVFCGFGRIGESFRGASHLYAQARMCVRYDPYLSFHVLPSFHVPLL
jgi:hypothetical protein